MAAKNGIAPMTLLAICREDIDTVVVLTPNWGRISTAIACGRAGKHVVVEKPMALLLRGALIWVVG
ncbi:Gfo/Idh/MocA family oxidoreductase [Bradyrhizobium sp.]|uniref:Gfo/Idh/MocA family oxidoreductase n=1 Tax=Bradyrhizobium sp. TaxID=376 RepID=UPI0027381268|nr:Gfo/Idh/MocA family oxidoreductase [Bradyrhizobium sp.]